MVYSSGKRVSSPELACQSVPAKDPFSIYRTLDSQLDLAEQSFSKLASMRSQQIGKTLSVFSSRGNKVNALKEVSIVKRERDVKKTSSLPPSNRSE